MVPQFSEIPKSKDAISGSFVLNAFFRLACWVSRIHIVESETQQAAHALEFAMNPRNDPRMRAQSMHRSQQERDGKGCFR